MNSLDTIASGKTTFPVETPYKLLTNGRDGEKPLLIYLHGFNQKLITMEKAMAPLLQLEAYHLFLEAPYPIFTKRKPVPKWGKSWYIYDGDQQRFKRGLEEAAEYIQGHIDRLSRQLNFSRVGVVGYSMGGYVAGYFGLSRYRHVTDLIIFGGRLKSEWFVDQDIDYSHLGILGVHGSRDDSVKPEPQQQSLNSMSDEGAQVTFKEIDEKHDLTDKYAEESVHWLTERGYLFAK